METYWKVNEVAATLQISAQTVYRYVAHGEIPFHKLNRAVRLKPSEIESWIETRMPSAMATRNERHGDCLFAETNSGETRTQGNTGGTGNEGGEA